MKKFVSILALVVLFNFLVSFDTTQSKSQPQDVEISFSDNAVAIESGQPVFNQGTKIWLSNPKQEEINIFLNEEVKKISSSKVELSQIVDIDQGTYTLVINTNTEEKIFGFTIQ